MNETVKTVMSVVSGAAGEWPIEVRASATVLCDRSRVVESSRVREVLTVMLPVTSGLTE